MMKPVAFVTDLNPFIEMVRKQRGIPEERLMARIAMDYGRGSFKVVISLFDRDQTADGLAEGEAKGRRFTGSYNTVPNRKLQVHSRYITCTLQVYFMYSTPVIPVKQV